MIVERYDQLLASQGGRCAICPATKPGKRGKFFHVDHDHSCCPGRTSCGLCVRGLLCQCCNAALGLLKDDVKLVRSAVSYLEAFHGGA